MDAESKERIERQIEINRQEIKMMRVQIDRYECANEQLRGLLEEIPQSIVTVGIKAARKALAAHRETLSGLEIPAIPQPFEPNVYYKTEEAINVLGEGFRDDLKDWRDQELIKCRKKGLRIEYLGRHLNKFAAQVKANRKAGK